MKLFDALISPILFYASEVWGIDCNGQLEKGPAELVQNKFLKWLLGVNKYCNNNAYRAETGRFPMRIGHFTVMDGSEGEGDLVLIQTFLLYYVNQVIPMLTSIFQEQFP